MAAKKANFEAKNLVIVGLRAGHKDLRSALAKVHKAQKDALWAGFKGASDLPARRSLLAAKLVKERLDLRDKCREEVAAVRAKYPRFPNFKDWIQPGRGRPAAPATMGVTGPETALSVKQHDLRDFTGQAAGRVVHYINSDGDRSFTDSGKTVTVIDTESPAAILAALQLCQAKFGEAKFDTTGSTDFKERVCQVAAAHGMRLKDPVLQSRVAKITTEIKAVKAEEIAYDRARATANAAIGKAERAARATSERVVWARTTAGSSDREVSRAAEYIGRAGGTVEQTIDRVVRLRAQELEDLKASVSIVDLAKSVGFVVADATGLGSQFVVLERDDNLLMVSRDDLGRDVFQSIADPERATGTVVDFVQALKLATNIGEARKVLRPWMSDSKQPGFRLSPSTYADRQHALRQLVDIVQVQTSHLRLTYQGGSADGSLQRP